ncbi:hypothetical protein FKR81_07605 [Lentzea tibetensis]|uniref:Uncharacterized protein n=1 Tax=Lentzea tibetensis TaxID=2591470 RepID=A0A563EZI4_9PSEU|nr:hypothetical protein [Lentzea tibetensis]TWP52962.1 hypothetical protein FKR81_07605 [Lentzea tibetensis]
MKHVGVVGAVVCAAVIGSTFVPGAPRVPLPVVLLLVVAAVPVLVVVGRRRLRFAGLRGVWQELRARVPMGAIAVAAVVFYGAWLLALITLVTGPGGAPEIRDGKYVLVNRNKVTEVSREVHDRAAVQGCG